MPPKRIFLLNGHPGATSLSKHLAETYARAATAAGHDLRVIHLHDLTFDADFGQAGYEGWKPLEPDLETVLAALQWCEHLVLFTPMWWGGLPARLKGLFDRILLPGTAFDPRKITLGLPEPLLKGRSARVVLTSDTPHWYFWAVYRLALFHQIRRQIFGFVGIKPTRFTHFPMASEASEDTVASWSGQICDLAVRGG